MIKHAPTGDVKKAHISHLKLADNNEQWTKVFESAEDIITHKETEELKKNKPGRGTLQPPRRQPVRSCRVSAPITHFAPQYGADDDSDMDTDKPQPVKRGYSVASQGDDDDSLTKRRRLFALSTEPPEQPEKSMVTRLLEWLAWK